MRIPFEIVFAGLLISVLAACSTTAVSGPTGKDPLPACTSPGDCAAHRPLCANAGFTQCVNKRCRYTATGSTCACFKGELTSCDAPDGGHAYKGEWGYLTCNVVDDSNASWSTSCSNL